MDLLVYLQLSSVVLSQLGILFSEQYHLLLQLCRPIFRLFWFVSLHCLVPLRLLEHLRIIANFTQLQPNPQLRPRRRCLSQQHRRRHVFIRLFMPVGMCFLVLPFTGSARQHPIQINFSLGQVLAGAVEASEVLTGEPLLFGTGGSGMFDLHLQRFPSEQPDLFLVGRLAGGEG